MSEFFVINTNSNSQNELQKSSDPYHHFPAKEWVDKQIEWANKTLPSGEGLIKHINKFPGKLIGCEIGVCLGFTTESFAKQIPNLDTLYAVDNYPSFIDWNGVDINEDRQKLMKEYAYNKLKIFDKKIKLIYNTSEEFSKTIEDNSLDFIFIDGDHSYSGVSRDLKNFFPKMKSGSLFGGHDYYLESVQKALIDFFGNRFKEIQNVENNAWFILV